MKHKTLTTWSLASVVMALGCAPVPEVDDDDTDSPEVIIGHNDLQLVGPQGGNVPARYAPLYPLVGQIHRYYVSEGNIQSKTCTASYLGRGIAMTAGHCLDAPTSEVRDRVCPGVLVSWGSVAGAPSTLRSACQRVLRARNDRAGTDYAFFEVFPPPTGELAVNLTAGASSASPTRGTMLSHPDGDPLSWSGTCALTTPYGSIFPHQCDSEGGSSGAPIFDDATLRVVGINLGTDAGLLNYGRFVSATPLAGLLSVASNQGSGVAVVTASTTLSCGPTGSVVVQDDRVARMTACNGLRSCTVTPEIPAGCRLLSTQAQYRCVPGGALQGVATNNAANPQLTMSCSVGGVAPSSFWTLFASEEGSPAITCDGPLGHDELTAPRAMTGLACRGDYCDSVAGQCPTTDRVPLTGASSWTTSFSEENPLKTCAAGAYVTGLRCSGSYCDNLALQCSPSTRPWGRCALQPSVSDEQESRTCPAGSFVAGVQCTGRYCDNLSMYCCEPG